MRTVAGGSRSRLLLPLLLLVVLASIAESASIHVHIGSSSTDKFKSSIRLVNIWPHNASAFTEGFFIENGLLYESTGLPNQSFISVARLDDMLQGTTGSTGTSMAQGPVVSQSFRFPGKSFGEGITAIGDKLYALTYQDRKILVLNRHDLSLVETHTFVTSTGEGWGMTTDGKYLIVSDGSSSIQWFDPTNNNFNCTKAITVHDQVRGTTNSHHQTVEIHRINELEYVDGQIFANVWHTNKLLRIHAETGRLLETMTLDWLPNFVTNLKTLSPPHMQQEAVMNGIAFHPESRHVFLTGKLWDSMFEMELSSLKRDNP